ncbi:hypothetical protein ACFX2H_039027 [Malus domestica]
MGPKVWAPFVKNMKATLGTWLNRNSPILGTNDALQNNSPSSSILCTKSASVSDVTLSGKGRSGGGGGCGRSCDIEAGGNSGDEEEDFKVVCKVNRKKVLHLQYKLTMTPMDKPMTQKHRKKGMAKLHILGLGQHL